MKSAFELHHPAVVFAFLAGAIALSMMGMHPVYGVLSVAGSFACSLVTRGFRPTVRALTWLVPLWCVVSLANPLFSASGSTELFRIGYRAIYLESLVYGMCAGAMLVSVFYWFMSYSACMTSDRVMCLFGRIMPIVTLMVSQVFRLVGQFTARGRTIDAVQRANSAAAPRSKRDRVQGRFRIVSVLMGWGMEDGIERSDAMRARGYDCGARRTTYRRYRLGRDDSALLALIAVLFLANVGLELIACGQFEFYPSMSELVLWWGYAVYVLYLLIPVFVYGREWLLWR